MSEFTRIELLKLLEDSKGDLSIALKKIIQRPFSVNQWGSCQYTTALNTYELLNLLDHHKIPLDQVGIYFTRKGLSGRVASFLPDSVQTQLGFDDPLTPLSHEEVFQTLEVMILKDSSDLVSDECMTQDERCAVLKKYKTCCNEKEFSLDPAMEILRGLAHDLWTAADQLIKLIYPNLEIQTQQLTKDSKGPEWNKIVQSGNSLTGTQCYLLKKYGWIKNEDSFKDFDT